MKFMNSIFNALFIILSLNLSLNLYAPGARASDFSNYLEGPQEQRDFLKESWTEVLGKKNLTPRSAKFVRNSKIIDELTKKVSSILEIKFEDIKSLNKLKVGGSFNELILVGNWNGKDVLLKFLSRNICGLELTNEQFEELLRIEIRNLLLANQLSIGPEFFGLVYTPKGPAIMMERRPGINLRAFDSFENKTAHIIEKEFHNMIAQLKTLILAGIVPIDPQFVISDKGALLIDLGLFWTKDHPHPDWLKSFLLNYTRIKLKMLEWPITWQQALQSFRVELDGLLLINWETDMFIDRTTEKTVNELGFRLAHPIDRPQSLWFKMKNYFRGK